MTYADILILLRAGYTKAEIDALQADDAAPEAAAQTPAADPVPAAPAQADDQTPAEDPQPVEQPATPPDPTQQVLQQITELVRAVQANNRSSAEMGAIIDPQQSAIDTLGALGGLPKPTK